MDCAQVRFSRFVHSAGGVRTRAHQNGQRAATKTPGGLLISNCCEIIPQSLRRWLPSQDRRPATPERWSNNIAVLNHDFATRATWRYYAGRSDRTLTGSVVHPCCRRLHRGGRFLTIENTSFAESFREGVVVDAKLAE